jgi:exodeoxyribonuclease V alpha subunit
VAASPRWAWLISKASSFWAVAIVPERAIFRQAVDSLIISNAHRINECKMPTTSPEAKDFFIFVKEAPNEAAELLVDVVKNRVPLKFKLHPLDDIQVLAPMYNGAVGVSNLNLLLQAALNPPAQLALRFALGGRLFRVGTR